MTPSPVSSLSVLLVDDDSFMLDLISNLLAELGVKTITTAKDGRTAMHAYSARTPPDLVLCDLHMPGQDGFQLMEELARRHYSGGVILISGQEGRILSSATLMAQFHQLHILGALSKPVARASLAELLANACAGRPAAA
jgi:CheY-like chemotaxis protein